MNPIQQEADLWIAAAKMAHEMGNEEMSHQALVNAGRVLLGFAGWQPDGERLSQGLREAK